jgi:glycosyltransferase involved in cell wall biosynthesis
LELVFVRGFTLKALLLSGYDAVSHKFWREGMVKNLDHIKWTALSLPPRFFAWRTRGNSLSFAYGHRDVLAQDYDFVLTTSMTDFSALRGMVPSLANIPSVVYFHENQFAYPENKSFHSDMEIKAISIYNALCGDKVIFNTEYNRKSFVEGSKKFLKKMPDFVPKGLPELIDSKSRSINVPINPFPGEIKKNSVPTILWNHRWEYDKAPERFYLVLKKLKEFGVDFRLNIVGQVFRESPPVFDQIKEEFAESIDRWGFQESRQEYDKALGESHFIISTAIHDFQGLAVLEAADAGCIPILPDRVAYPELFDKEFIYKVDDDPEKEAENCAKMIRDYCGNLPESPDMSGLYWEKLKDDYDRCFKELLNS